MMNEGGSRASLQLTVNESAFFLSFILWMAFLTWSRARTLERATAALAEQEILQQVMGKKQLLFQKHSWTYTACCTDNNPSYPLDC